MSFFDDLKKNPKIRNHPIFRNADLSIKRSRKIAEGLSSEDLKDEFSESPMLDTGPKERNDLVADAVKEVEASVHQFEWPMPPVIHFTGMKKAKFATHDPRKVIKAELTFTVDFVTKTGATLQLEVPVSVNRGTVVPPSTFYFENRQYVFGQKAVDAIIKRNTSYYIEPMRKMFQPVFNKEEQQVAAQNKYEQGYKARENDGMFGGRGIVKDRRLAKEKPYGEDDPIYPMGDENGIALELLDWHGGQGSDLYAVGSSWYAGYKVDALAVWGALWELKDAVKYYSDKDDEEAKEAYSSGLSLISSLEEQIKEAESNGWDMDDPRYENARVKNMVSAAKKAQFEDMSEDEAFSFLNKQVKQLGKDFHPGKDDIDDRSGILDEIAEFLESDEDDRRFSRKAQAYEYSDGVEDKYVEMINEEYAYNRAREIVEEHDVDYANARDMAVDFSDEFGSGESIYWWEDVARMFLEGEFGEITNPKKGQAKKARQHKKPAVYEQVVKLMEAAKELGTDSFPRMYEHIEAEYILDVLNTASRDQWEMHLINDGWALNPKERIFRKKRV